MATCSQDDWYRSREQALIHSYLDMTYNCAQRLGLLIMIFIESVVQLTASCIQSALSKTQRAFYESKSSNCRSFSSDLLKTGKSWSFARSFLRSPRISWLCTLWDSPWVSKAVSVARRTGTELYVPWQSLLHSLSSSLGLSTFSESCQSAQSTQSSPT